VEYKFDWDPRKDKVNRRKHEVSFRQVASIFLDPNQLSTFDEEHSEKEDRWITLGLDSTGVLRLVIHTFESVTDELCRIRIISARNAEPEEQAQYLEMQDESKI
jgi:uncharacterized protein